MSKKSTDIGVGKKVLASALSAAMVVAFAPAVGAAVGSDDAVAYAEDAAQAASVTEVGNESELRDAVNSVSEGGIIRLSTDITLSRSLTAEQSFTLDLNGKTLTGDVSYTDAVLLTKYKSPTVEVKNGSVKSNGLGFSWAAGELRLANVNVESDCVAVKCCDGAVVTVGKDAVVKSTSSNAIYIEGSRYLDSASVPVLNIYGTVSSTGTGQYAKSAAIQGNGSDKVGTKINIYDGAKVTANKIAIFQPQRGELNIYGGLVEGYAGIGIKSGTLNISGGVVRGVADDSDIEDQHSITGGINYDGSAIIIDSYIGGYAGQMNINISGDVSVESLHSTAIREIGNTAGQTNVVSIGVTGGTVKASDGKEAIKVRDVTKNTVSVTGGMFSSDPSAYLVRGFTASESNGVYTVSAPVAEIDGVKYGSLQAAVDAAADAQSVTLLANTQESLTIPAGKNITLDLNGKKLTNVAGQHTITNNGTLTITGKGTIDNVSHGKASVENAVGATCNILSGTITRSQETGASATVSGGNSFYYIENYGTMAIGAVGASNDEVNVISNGHFSSLVHNGWYDGTKNTAKNVAVLTVNSGYFQGGINTLKNDDFGKIIVNGGKAVNATQYAVFNVNEAEIDGGEFESTTNAAVWNGAYDADGDKGVLHIKGGSFKSVGGNDVSETNCGAVPVTVLTGGVYSTDVSKFIDKKTVAEYKMLDGTYVVSATEPAHTGNGNAYSGPVDGVYTEYVYSAPVTPVDPTPTPTPTPEPAAPGTNVSGTDAAGNTVEATVTDNNKTTLPDGTEAAGSVEFKGTTSGSGSGQPASEAAIPSTVTSNGSTYVVTKIADGAFEGQEQLTKVTIPETVVEIGSKAFANTSISSVVIPAATTTIGAGVFQGCDDLESVDISKAALTSIPADAFNGTAISSISIPGTVKSVGARAFKGTALKSVELPAATTTLGTAAFQGCASLKSADISKAALTEIPAYAFNGASITSIDIPDTVKTIGKRAFKKTKLKTVSTDAESLERGAFSGCASLKSASLPEVTEIGEYAFYGNDALKTLTTGADLEVIGPKAFKGAGKFKVLRINSKRLTKSGVKGSLKGSAVTKVEVAVTGSKKTQDKYVKRYSKFFAKANSGKSVKVVKAKKAAKK